jgi:hypothetical protein
MGVHVPAGVVGGESNVPDYRLRERRVAFT